MRSPIVVTLLAVLAVPTSAAAQVIYGGSSTLSDTVLKGGAIQGFEARTGLKFQSRYSIEDGIRDYFGGTGVPVRR